MLILQARLWLKNLLVDLVKKDVGESNGQRRMRQILAKMQMRY